MKTVFITGAAGFLGSHLCDRMLRDGYNVVGIDNFYTGSKNNISHLTQNPHFNFIEDDISQYDISTYSGKIDYILNFACPASPQYYQKDPIFTLDTCYKGTKNMLEFAIKHNAVILQASTSETYGDPFVHPQQENYFGNVNPCGLRSCYDEGKRVAETLMFDYARKYNGKIKVLRIFNTYGPRMDKNDGRVVSNFIVQALADKNITIHGNGEQTRSFCYVDDLIEGITCMLFSEDSFKGPVNIGTEFEFSINWLAKKIIELTNSKSVIVNKTLPSDDPKRRRADLTLARKKLNYEPKISIEEGLIKTIEYFKIKRIKYQTNA